MDANAWHATGALIAEDGRLTELPSTGPVIGALWDMRYEEAEQQFDLDESLFLYTDGLTEARRGDELFGEERVLKLLTRLKGGGPAAIVRDVISEVFDFAGGRLSDDLALLCLKRLENGLRRARSEGVELQA